GSDVRRRDRDVGRQHGRLAALDLRERVGLLHVQVRARDRVDRTGVVEERVAGAHGGLEAEAVHDVGRVVAVVVDVEVVPNVVTEVREVRTAGGFFQRYP